MKSLDMEGEMRNLIKVGLCVAASLSYCHLISSRIPKGMIRLLTFLPVISIFTLLPLFLSSVALQLSAGLIFSWLANFKLLVFAIGPDDGPCPYTDSLLKFIVITSLPVKMKQDREKNEKPGNNLNSHLTSVVHLLLCCFSFQVYTNKFYKILAGPIGVHCLYTLRFLSSLQLGYKLAGVVAQKILKCEVEPQFIDPHLSSSVQNFWGERWNRMNSSALRSVIYTPTRSFFTPVVGKRWSRSLAILATFTVSGLMHELAYFYTGVAWPTWEVTWLFIMNGAWVSIEIEMKKKASEIGWVLHPMISWLLTLGFISVTGAWLCCREFVRYGVDIREIEECAMLVDHIKSVLRKLV